MMEHVAPDPVDPGPQCCAGNPQLPGPKPGPSGNPPAARAIRARTRRLRTRAGHGSPHTARPATASRSAVRTPDSSPLWGAPPEPTTVTVCGRHRESSCHLVRCAARRAGVRAPVPRDSHCCSTSGRAVLLECRIVLHEGAVITVLSRRTDIDQLLALLGTRENVVVQGAPGTGKSTVLRTAAEESGMRVVTVPVNAAEQPLPGSGIAILAAALRVIGDGSLAAGIEDLHLDESAAPVVAETFMAALRADGGTEDLLLVVDDADVLDPYTQSFLGFVLRRLTGDRVRFAVSVAALDPDGPFSGTTTIELQQLDPAASLRAALELSPGLDPAAARVVAAGAVGHLLTLEQVIGTLGERQRSGRAPLPRPLRSTEAMDALAAAELAGLSDEALTILRTLAIAPRASFLPLLAGYSTLWEDLAELEARDLVSRVGSHLRIRDPRIRSSIHWAMSAGERAALHVQMMRACEDADPALSLWHSTFAGHREDAAHRLIAHACALVDEGTRRGWSRRRRSRSSRCAPGTSAARRWPRRSCSRGSTTSRCAGSPSAAPAPTPGPGTGRPPR